jgi:protein kinase/serine/threonine-protein kinase
MSVKRKLEIGDIVDGRYEVRSRIGSGGFAQALEATDARTDDTVCLKHPNLENPSMGNQTILEYFEKEIQILGEIGSKASHPGVVGYIDDVEVDGLPVLVVEYIEGETFVSKYHGAGMNDPDRAVSVGVDLCEALMYIHRTDYIYRDIKPGNIMITPDDRVVFVDFNTAKGFDPEKAPDEIDSRGSKVESPFAPPEIKNPRTNDIPQGPWSDVYAIAKIVMYLLKGNVPRKDGVDPRDFNVACPDPLGEIIRRATQYDRTDRYSNARALKRALENGDPTPPDQAILRHVNTGREYELAPGDTVGRRGGTGAPANVVVDDPGDDRGRACISSVHVELGKDPDDGWLLQDRSLNGTYVHKGVDRNEPWKRVHWSQGRDRLNRKRRNDGSASGRRTGVGPFESVPLGAGDLVALVGKNYGVNFRFYPNRRAAKRSRRDR